MYYQASHDGAGTPYAHSMLGGLSDQVNIYGMPCTLPSLGQVKGEAAGGQNSLASLART
jgi:hypothetical protein